MDQYWPGAQSRVPGVFDKGSLKKMKRIFLLALGAGLCATAFGATETIRYEVRMDSGVKAGEQVVEQDDDGQTRVKLLYKNNGRGPDLVESYRVGADGAMNDYRIKGNSTFGAVVDERFERRGDAASWQSTSERGSATVKGPALYVALNSTYTFTSLALAAQRGQPDAPVALLPSGALTIRKLDQMQVTSGGKSQNVDLIALTGLGMTPRFRWVTQGPKARLFASISPGFMSVTEAGWQDAVKPMAERQKAAEAAVLVDIATRLQRKLTGLTVVRNARIFDSEKATVGQPSDVYVLRGRITAVLPAGSPVRADQEIDAAGRIMLPGLFDMHGHVGRWEGGLNIAAGVTTVRDMGNGNAELQTLIDDTAAGRLLGPQVVAAGFLEGQSKYSANMGFVIKDLDGAKNAIDWYHQHGYPQLKIYNSFPKAILKDTVAYAHLRGMHVSGHIPAGLRAHEALDAGYDEVNHINQVMLNFLATPETETRTLERFVLPSEKTADLDFNAPVVKKFIARLKQQGTVIDPTLATFAFLKQKDGDMNAPFAAVADHMPPDVKRDFYVGTMKIADAATLARYEKSYAKMVQFVGLLHRAGVPLVAGTDEMAGFTLQAELELLVQAGLSPAEALQVATRNGARYTRTSADRGSVTPGKLADLVLVDGDPTRQIGDIRKVAAVITRGFLVYPHEIDKELGIVPFVKDAPQLRALAPVAAGSVAGGAMHAH
jgi:imidazolonepropionase-like amidohydrolase